MNRFEAEIKLDELFGQVENGDYSEIEKFVEDNEYEFDEDLAELAFRMAVRGGHIEYVSNHISDVDLNDGDGGSTYCDVILRFTDIATETPADPFMNPSQI